MEELLEQLKTRVASLLGKHQRLKKDHLGLAEQQALLAQEKKILQEKHTVAIQNIERMIDRLKSLEKRS